MRLGALRGKAGVMAVLGVAGVCAAIAIALVSATAGASAPATMLISVAAAGGFSDGDSFLSGSARQIDSVGRFVVFASSSSDLVATPDTNGLQDVYLRDNLTGTTQRVSIASDGGEPDGGSYSPSVSADGRYVAFASDATNLVPDDTAGLTDVFVRDMTSAVTTRVSLSAAGFEPDGPSYSPSISADGQRVAFASDATNLITGDTNFTTDVFVRYLSPSVVTLRVSNSMFGGDANGPSYSPVISGEGGAVVFVSDATDLVSGDSGATTDVFVVGLGAGLPVTRVSVTPSGAEANGPSFFCAISADGRFVAFASLADDLVTGDTNGQMDVFRFDRFGGTTIRIDVPSVGGETDGASYSPSISGDGSVVVFASDATNLVTDDGNFNTDVFARNVPAGTTKRVSLSTTGGDADAASFSSVVTDDGTQVAFASSAGNLIPEGGNGLYQVFQASIGGSGATPAIDLSVSGTLALPPAPVGGSSDSPVTITNTGTGDLHISGLTVVGGAFLLVTPPCPAPAVLAPGASCTIIVRSVPHVAGPALGTLTVTSDAPTSPTTLALFGNGLQPAAAGGGYVLLPGAPPSSSKLIERSRERFEFAFRMPRDGVVKGKRITYRYFAGGSFWVVRSLSVARLTPGVAGGCPTESFGGPAEVRRLSAGGTELAPEPGTYWVEIDASDCGAVPGSSPQSGVGFDRIAIELLAGGEFGSPLHVLGGTPGVRLPIASGNIGVRLVDVTAPPLPV